MSRIMVDFSNKIFEIEGDNDFVDQKFSILKDMMKECGEKEDKKKEQIEKEEDNVKRLKNNTFIGDSNRELYKKSFFDSGLIYDEDDELKLNFTIPGNNNSAITRNLAIIMAFFEKEIKKDEIRNMLIDYGAYDSSNFSAYLNKAGNNLIRKKNSDGEVIISITRIGEKKAVELLDDVVEKNELQ